MLRKLIVLAVTSGLAKKAWDMYRLNGGRVSPVAASGGTGRRHNSTKPVVRAKSYDTVRPDAS